LVADLLAQRVAPNLDLRDQRPRREDRPSNRRDEGAVVNGQRDPPPRRRATAEPFDRLDQVADEVEAAFGGSLGG